MENNSQLLLTLGRYGLLHGRLRREIRGRIWEASRAYLRPGAPIYDAHAFRSICYYCRAAKERWVEFEPMLSHSGYSIQYAMGVLGMPYGLAIHWSDYLDWVDRGSKPIVNEEARLLYGRIGKYCDATD